MDWKQKLRYWPTLAVSLLIPIAVLLPGSKVPDIKLVGFDKIVHVIMFGAWTIALRNDFPKWQIAGVVALGLLFSLLTEVLQIFAEERSFDWYDTMADAVGLIVGSILAKPTLKLFWSLFDKEEDAND